MLHRLADAELDEHAPDGLPGLGFRLKVTLKLQDDGAWHGVRLEVRGFELAEITRLWWFGHDLLQTGTHER